MAYDRVKCGSNAKEARIAKGLTQREVARAINLTTAYISFIENGRKTVSVDTLVGLCDLLERTPDELLGYNPMEKKDFNPYLLAAKAYEGSPQRTEDLVRLINKMWEMSKNSSLRQRSVR